MNILELGGFSSQSEVEILINISDAVNFLTNSGVGKYTFDQTVIQLQTFHNADFNKLEIIYRNDLVCWTNDIIQRVSAQRFNYSSISGHVQYDKCVTLSKILLENVFSYFGNRSTSVKTLNVILEKKQHSSKYGVTKFYNNGEDLTVIIYVGNHTSEIHVLGTVLHEIGHCLLTPYMDHNAFWVTITACLVSVAQTFLPTSDMYRIAVAEVGPNFKPKYF